MHLTKTRTLSIAVAATFAAGLAATSASAAPVSGDVPTFQEFAASTYQDEGGVYVVNGDEPEGSIGGLRQFYDSMVSTPKHVDEDSLIVNRRQRQGRQVVGDAGRQPHLLREHEVRR